ncbi:MAG: hypothetical protein J7502_00075 [Flavisolibacter sp.]|nr:hypothetical protein [Flavisolibacter sp.]
MLQPGFSYRTGISLQDVDEPLSFARAAFTICKYIQYHAKGGNSGPKAMMRNRMLLILYPHGESASAVTVMTRCFLNRDFLTLKITHHGKTKRDH